MKNLFFYDDKIQSESDCKINILSPTVQYGLNVFEGIRCYYDNKTQTLYALELDKHIKRLLESAQLLGISCKYSTSQIKNYFIETINKNHFKEDIAIRIVLYAPNNGSWAGNNEFKLLIAPRPYGRVFQEFDNGITTAFSSWKRLSLNAMPPSIKCGANYVNSRLAQIEATRNGYQMALFLDERGYVSEAPGSCLFIVKENILYTPGIDSAILDSITRKLIIRIAGHLGINCKVNTLTRIEVMNADSAFLCGTSIEMVKIKSIDGIELNDKDCKIYDEIIKCFFKITKNSIEEFNDVISKI